MSVNKKELEMNTKVKSLIGVLIVAVLGLVAAIIGINANIKINSDGEGFSAEIQLAETQVPALIETDNGEIEVLGAPTVESVDGNGLTDECPEGETECGKGRYIWAPTESPQAFRDYTYGGCWNSDLAWGAQCWDLADIYFQNYAGRNFSTCGTGAAKGSWNCKEYNAGDEFELIYDATALQAGDWVIFGAGQYGHVGMALGGYNNGYVALLGQNQGGKTCEGGGSAANIINISLSSFVGAFRPKSYIKPEPQPVPEPTPEPVADKCEVWEVKKGDTLGKIMYTCRGEIEWGAAMDDYAGHWYSTTFKKYLTVFDGWNSTNGVGLFAGDTIEYRAE